MIDELDGIRKDRTVS